MNNELFRITAHLEEWRRLKDGLAQAKTLLEQERQTWQQNRLNGVPLPK